MRKQYNQMLAALAAGNAYTVPANRGFVAVAGTDAAVRKTALLRDLSALYGEAVADRWPDLVELEHDLLSELTTAPDFTSACVGFVESLLERAQVASDD